MVPAPSFVGATIDSKYRVERVLGQGGMGVVVAARHLRLGQLVAIKFPLSTTRLRDDSVERLLREARATMRIRSEHVAKVHDVGLHETAGPYLVMEYLVGRDLGTVLVQDGPVPAGLAVQYILQVCEALAEAHAKGIVHRDIKPSNLFLSRRTDGDPHIKVIDFGLAKTHHDEDQVSLTKSGAMLGSPLFMAPEQMRGSAEVDARADIWALGATLHALLTGEPPFPGRNLLDVHERIKLGPPKLTTARPEVGTDIEAAMLGCLSVAPSERHATVADFAEALALAAPIHVSGSARRIRRILQSTGAEASLDGDDRKGQPVGFAHVRDQAQATTAGGLSASWRDESARGMRTRVETDASLPLSAQPRSARRPWLAVVAIVGPPVVVGAAVSLMRGPGTVSTGKPSGASSFVVSHAVAIPASVLPRASALPASATQKPASVVAVGSVTAGRSVRVRAPVVPARAAAGSPGAPRDPLADPD